MRQRQKKKVEEKDGRDEGDRFDHAADNSLFATPLAITEKLSAEGLESPALAAEDRQVGIMNQSPPVPPYPLKQLILLIGIETLVKAAVAEKTPPAETQVAEDQLTIAGYAHTPGPAVAVAHPSSAECRCEEHGKSVLKSGVRIRGKGRSPCHGNGRIRIMPDYPVKKLRRYLGIVVKEIEDVAGGGFSRQIALPARLETFGNQYLEGGGRILRLAHAGNGAYRSPRLHRDYDGNLRSFSHLLPHMKKPGKSRLFFEYYCSKSVFTIKTIA